MVGPETRPTPDRSAGAHGTGARATNAPSGPPGTGVLRTGTSGFAYRGWVPRFYPPALRAEGFLAHYASRLRAVELNNTFYRQPTERAVATWLGATDSEFRFAVKAQRGGSYRAWIAAATDAPPLDWLVTPYRAFRDRLGAVLFRVPGEIERDDDRLARLLDAWPAELPVVMEFQHPSWEVDEVLASLRGAGAAWCVTELDEHAAPPSIHVTGDRLYLRLRRSEYRPAEITAWAERLVPFLESGLDAYAFFRHDEIGRGAESAIELASQVATRLGRA